MEPPQPIDLTDVDTFHEGFPHAWFRWARSEAPLFWHEPTAHTPDREGFWVVSRHADAVRIILNPATFSSDTGGSRRRGGTMIQDQAGAGNMLNMMDDPRHRRIRGLVSKGLTPRRIEELAPELGRRTQAILDAVAGEDAFDFVGRVARELPLQAICLLLGVPQEDRDELCSWVDLGLESDSTQVMAAEYGSRLVRYGAELIAARRADPRDDMLSVVVHATLPDEEPPELTDAELNAFFVLLFTAGSETTRKAIAGGVKAFAEDPASWERLRREPALLPTAVDEIVRWTTPSVYKRRTATRDVEMLGHKIRTGDKVTFWEMSANRDERVFDAPFRFDVGRSPNPHLGFGQGVHFCLGANLARLEMRVMFEALLERYAGFELAGPPTWTPTNRLYGLKHLPLRAVPRS